MRKKYRYLTNKKSYSFAYYIIGLWLLLAIYLLITDRDLSEKIFIIVVSAILVAAVMREGREINTYIELSDEGILFSSDKERIFSPWDGIILIKYYIHRFSRKLRNGPLSLPKKDVDALLKETPPDPYTLPLNSPAALDVLWGFFTATGDAKVVQRIFDLVRSNWSHYETAGDIGPEKLVLIQSARWSLTSMAAQHQKVQAVLIAERSKSKEAATLLEESEKEKQRK